jgi:hypothetical protein
LAISSALPPIGTVRLAGLIVTPVTATYGVTVTEQVALNLPSTVVTVIVVVPGRRAVTTPLLTLAMRGLLLVHVTFWFAAFRGITSAVS